MNGPQHDYAERPTTQPGAIDHLRESLGYLHDRIDLLENRLVPVMGSDFPQAVASDRDVPPSELHRLLDETQRAGTRLDNIIARLVV